MNDLIQQVQAASTDQPDWLRKKRQLAAMLLTRFSTGADCDDWVTAWQKKPQLTWLTEKQETENDSEIYNQPLHWAWQTYPALCQENWMEKGLFWQHSQLNALHLALLNGGRLIYVPDNTNVEETVQLKGQLAATNYHTLVIVGAGAHLQIKDQREFISHQPAMTGLEILLGTGAEVNYQWHVDCQADESYIAVGSYQAQGSSLRVKIAGHNASKSVLALRGDLDGDDSQVAVNVDNLTHSTVVNSHVDSHFSQDCTYQRQLLAAERPWQLTGSFGQAVTIK
ncbi:hypothetical protein [Limosilactobacillus sp.]|uniref:hypothetical protein n=1 Tax=Limosilactobacillus sp. TaxID=2773925 RepID=UPI00345E2231